jgi:hypothetical protein
LELDRRAFAFWDVDRDDWTVEPGEFELASARRHARSRTTKLRRRGSLPGRSGSADDQDRAVRLVGDGVRDAAEDPARAVHALVAHDDEVGIDLARDAQDRGRGSPGSA